MEDTLRLLPAARSGNNSLVLPLFLKVFLAGEKALPFQCGLNMVLLQSWKEHVWQILNMAIHSSDEAGIL